MSTCISGNGNGAGRNAFSARRSSTIESLPPLNSSTGRSNSAATSRITWIASDSSARRWLSWGRAATLISELRSLDDLDVQAALGLVGARPAALAAAAGLRAGRAADRLVALVVQRVVGQVALVDPPPQVLVGPVRQRVVLPQAALLVAFDQLGARARGSLLAADAGDPALGARERAARARPPSRPSSSARARSTGRRGCSRRGPRSSRRSAPRRPARSAASPRTARRCRSSRSAPRRRCPGRGAAARRAAPTPPSGRSTAAPRARRGARPRAACASGSAPGRARRRPPLIWLSLWTHAVASSLVVGSSA